MPPVCVDSAGAGVELAAEFVEFPLLRALIVTNRRAYECVFQLPYWRSILIDANYNEYIGIQNGDYKKQMGSTSHIKCSILKSISYWLRIAFHR